MKWIVCIASLMDWVYYTPCILYSLGKIVLRQGIIFLLFDGLVTLPRRRTPGAPVQRYSCLA